MFNRYPLLIYNTNTCRVNKYVNPIDPQVKLQQGTGINHAFRGKHIEKYILDKAINIYCNEYFFNTI